MAEQNPIFRQKNLDRISSPEKLNDYIKVANPSIWLILLGIIVLLVGVCTWGIFGSLYTTLDVPIVIKDGKAYAYIVEEHINELSTDTDVSFSGVTTNISTIGSDIVQAAECGDNYFLHAGNMNGEEWLVGCQLESNCDLKDGTYAGKVILEKISPMKFVTN